jgi:dienelactone hydrolase
MNGNIIMPTLSVHPHTALADISRRIVLEGFAPGAELTVTALSRQPDGSVWQSAASFQADAQGAADLAQAAPLHGSYQGVAPDGLIWSQSILPDDHPDSHAAPARANLTDPIAVRLTASDGTSSAHAVLTQVLAGQGVTRREVREAGIVGTLFTPAAANAPAIVVLNGSNGGINEERAALLASHGYAALALGYFGAPGLPGNLANIPLEMFRDALAWLRRTVQPAGDFVAVSGHSRGGELSLLLGATFPEAVSAVVAYVPSSVVHGVLNAGPAGQGRFVTAWTLGAKPVQAHVWQDNPAQDWSVVDNLPEPRRQALAFVRAQRDAAAVARARIPVERIAGPVLLLSGGDDGYWPSTEYAAAVAQTLHAAHHPYPVVHRDYPQAGHAIQAPHVPTTRISQAHAVSGIVLTGGGNAAVNAQANEESWRTVLAFLADAVAARLKSK